MLEQIVRRLDPAARDAAVAIDEQGKPAAVPALTPETDEERARFKDRQERRARKP